MASTKVPLIEFNRENMERGSKGWASTTQAIRKAFEEYGCFEASYDEIGPKTNEDLLRTLEELFNLDLEAKQRFTSDVRNLGYSRREDPLFEVMAVSDALAFHTIESFVRVLFPQENENVQICETIHSYVIKIWELEKAVKKMVFESFGVEDYFEEQEKSMHYALRLLKYGLGTTKESWGKELGPHYDKNFVTILHEYGANGLQVKTRDNQWIQPTLSGSSFLVMVGEAFYGWSNARLQCALHRVKMSEDEESKAIRYSIGLFSSQNGIVRIPSEVVDEKHPLLFKPFDETGLIRAFFKDTQTSQNYSGGRFAPTLNDHFAI